ncbi:MAG TPA: oligosaccharide flippase family protein [Ignavibacteriaceae bacterium]|nr:oligosaccharide flippase family protein [Ignavibacteriaceae bacterium]
MFDKLKELTKDTAIYGISTMIGRFLNFILVPFYTNIFSPGDYGIVILVYSYIAILNIFFIYGMDAAFLKYAAFKDIGDDKDNFSTPYISVFITSVFFSGLLIILNNSITEWIGVPLNYSSIIILSSVIIFVDANAVIPFLKLRLEREAKQFAAIKVLNILLNILLNVVLIVGMGWGIEAIFISNLTASLLSLVLVSPTIIRFFKLSFHKVLFNRLLKFGLPYLPAGIAIMLVQVVDVPILERLTDLDTVGIYKANYKLGIFMMLFVNMFQYAWQPFFLQNAKEENAKQMFSKVMTYFSIVGFTMLIILSLFIDDIVKINFGGFSIIGAQYWRGLEIVPIILLGYLFNGFYVVFSAGIYIEEKSIYAPIVAGAGAVTNIVSNLLLIPAFGIMGAAFATLISYGVMALGYFLVTQKYYKIDYDFSRLIKLFVLALFIGASYYFLRSTDELNLFVKLAMLIVYVSILFKFIIDPSELRMLKEKLIKQRNK